MINQFNSEEKKQIVFEYEVLKNIPKSERITKWNSEEDRAVSDVSAEIINQRCSEIFKEMSFEDLHTGFVGLTLDSCYEIQQNIISQIDSLKNKAVKDITRLGSPWGSWFGTIAHPDRPEDYIQIDITGYVTTNSVIESATLVLNNNVQEAVVMREVNANDYLDFEFRNNTGFAQKIAELFTDRADPSLLKGYEFYAPKLFKLDGHAIEDHYKLLRKNGFDDMPSYEKYNAQMKEKVEAEKKEENKPSKLSDIIKNAAARQAKKAMTGLSMSKDSKGRE